MNATEIIKALADNGILATWGNTGGGVYNIVVDIDYVGTVQISDSGDWGYGDIDTEADSVSVIGYDPEGDSVVDERSQDLVYATDIAEVLALFHDMAEAVRETFLNTDDCCSSCGLVFPVRSMTDQTRFGYDPTRVMTCATCTAKGL